MHDVSKAKSRKIDAPSGRGGASTDVVVRVGDGARRSMTAPRAWRRYEDDANLVYLVARVRNYVDLMQSRLETLRGAIDRGDAAAVTDLARALTDATARMGAVRMMRQAIALQMLGRRELLDQAHAVQRELEMEFESFKGTLISYGG